MELNKDISSLEYWAQEQYLRNTDGSINTGAMKQAWPGQSKSRFETQLSELGYNVLPTPPTHALMDIEHMTYEEFMTIYEFGNPVREYILIAAKMNKKLTRETLFNWVKEMKPAKVENYGRDYSSVRV